MARGKIQSRIGVVVGNKMDKTVIVDVIRTKKHPRYNKPIKLNSKFKAHDESGECKVGDKVIIVGSRPYSKTKRWRVTKVIEQSKLIEDELSPEAEQGGV